MAEKKSKETTTTKAVAKAVAVATDPSTGSLLSSSRFMFAAAGALVTSAFLYEWYRDTYATPAQRLARVGADYVVGLRKLADMRKAMLREMAVGLKELDSTPNAEKRSSLKMLGSNVFNIPSGEETGVFYTLDFGGSHYRVLRVKLNGRGVQPETSELNVDMAPHMHVMEDSQMLFDFLAVTAKEHIETHDDYLPSEPFPAGFTFSFPMSHPSLKSGILLNWTKNVEVPGIVGKDVSKLMHAAFDRFKVPLEIKAICSDTVGTLLACAYEHSHCRIGVIVGLTASNAAYVEPCNTEIVNTEWGNFNKLPRARIDHIMDVYCQHPGHQLAEKMMAGIYIGELSRLLAVEVFRTAITKLPCDSRLQQKWGFSFEMAIAVLRFGEEYAAVAEYLAKECQWAACSSADARVFQEICQLIVDRSADLTAAMLSAVMEKAGLFVTQRTADGSERYEVNAEFCHVNAELCDGKCDEDSWLTVGFDGSVFRDVPGYKKRMKETLCAILGDEIGNRVNLVKAEDGSGKGAALAVASQFHAKLTSPEVEHEPARAIDIRRMSASAISK